MHQKHAGASTGRCEQSRQNYVGRNDWIKVLLGSLGVNMGSAIDQDSRARGRHAGNDPRRITNV
jgi:hypothetical protein